MYSCSHMHDSFITEIIISCVLVALSILFLDPGGFFDSMPGYMMASLVLLVCYVLFAAFIWRENGRDEREQFHKMMAGRFAYLAGVGVLVLGIILEELGHSLDPWLVIALSGMVLAKVAGLMYGRIRK